MEAPASGPKQRRGLAIVHTGEGKGKTTAALGMALRAVGHGMTVAVLQFIKGAWRYGELDAAGKLPGFEIVPMGRGFTWDTKDPEQDRRDAREAFEECRRRARSGEFDLLVCDEILYAVKYGWVSPAEVVGLIQERQPHVHLVLTGRGAPPEVVEAADLVTEMRSVKHPFAKGVKAQKGIEF